MAAGRLIPPVWRKASLPDQVTGGLGCRVPAADLLTGSQQTPRLVEYGRSLGMQPGTLSEAAFRRGEPDYVLLLLRKGESPCQTTR